MSRETDVAGDTLLDRMQHIAEEEGDEDEEDREDEFSIEGPTFRGVSGEEDDEVFDDEFDGFEDTSSRLDFDWPAATVEDFSETTSFSSGPFDGASSDEAISLYNRRGSFKQPKRRSISRYAMNADTSGKGTQQKRNSPIPPSRRRPSILLSSSTEEEQKKSSNNTTSVRRASRKKSFRRPSRSSISVPSAASTGEASMDMAMSKLSQEGNTWESIAAAAAVVKLTEGTNNKRPKIQFNVNDYALVFLSILNITCPTENQDAFTVNPVNKFGYPRGEGEKPEEKQGPHTYVLAKVKKVHFDEDVPYYTVMREDCGTEQRADSAWMEKITSPAAIESATVAARQTRRSVSENDTNEKEDRSNFWRNLVSRFGRPIYFASETVFPLLRLARTKAKDQITLILYGSNPYYCKIQVTSVNILIFCSILYLFLDVITLAFLPASSDYAVAVVGCIIWSILFMELVLEWLIRPKGYSDLILSEKSYAPTTARNINSIHLVFETLSLILYIPEFLRLHSQRELIPFTYTWASRRAILGPSLLQSALGRFFIGLRSLRMFSLIRHWKNLLINNIIDTNKTRRSRITNLLINDDEYETPRFSRLKTRDDSTENDFTSNEEEQQLKKAATIGTALTVINSHRALFLLLSIAIMLPILQSINGVNSATKRMTNLLHTITDNPECTEITQAIEWWENGFSISESGTNTNTNVLFAWVESSRCKDFENGTIIHNITKIMKEEATVKKIASKLGLREEGIIVESRSNPDFKIEIFYDTNNSIAKMNVESFFQLLSCFILVLAWITVLRVDTGRLVLHPLQRMLKIVVRYAKNPLSPAVVPKTRYKRKKSIDKENSGYSSDAEREGEKEELGNYETEQLISAISKIADLLRKCWGVAGAGIISTNLARTQDGKTVVFNPTVPGKRVYAIFGFVTINGFSDHLRALDKEVMILINDIAKVVHDEIYRWALGNTGQCNKNLGSSFLLVFRIGDFDEVHEKLKNVTKIIFQQAIPEKEKSSKKGTVAKRRKKTVRRGAMYTITSKREKKKGFSLSKLPGIQSFSDRSLLGMLKSFAGINRDQKLIEWGEDFRLSAGVGTYTINIIIGMDAGWAVEGAVGSEYKIDATYLSPHVNMAARMMSATKQYGVTILLSQAVEELLSNQARSKLRHLDTVYVKGSSVAQKIFTYDARHQGVDFFLLERSQEQYDADAEGYTPLIWEQDQDLTAMRQHVTEDFTMKFKEGKDLYLSGEWEKAVKVLYEADDIMIRTVLENGWIDYNEGDADEAIFDRQNLTEENRRIRCEHGDGACQCLIAYMEKRDCMAPLDWNGVKPLTSK